MDKTRLLLLLLLAIVIVETSAIALPVLLPRSTGPDYIASPPQVLRFPFSVFNQPISNDTDYALSPAYGGSWTVTVQSSLVPSPDRNASEAQIALAPYFRSENLSIPTIIVQERADGLLRVEYYAQDWKNTFGLVMYNSSAPGWTPGENVTLRFLSFGPSAEVNPQLAPRPNGNLTILISGKTVLSDYPIAWASLSKIYLYGYPDSSFANGEIRIAFQGLSRR